MSGKELPEVAEVQRLRLEPGDRIVVRCQGHLSMADAAAIKERVRADLRLPEDFPVLALPAEMSLVAVQPS